MFKPSHLPKGMLAGVLLAATALTGCGPDSRVGAAAASASAPSSAAMSSASAAAMASGAAPAPVALADSSAPAPFSSSACPKIAAPACLAPAAKPVRRAAAWTSGRHGWRHARVFHRVRVVERTVPAHDDLMGGPARSFADGYRMRETERTEISRAHGGEIIDRYREEVRGGPDCVNGCIPGWTGDWRGGRYRTAGIDRSGYLVWPGKIEY